MVIFANENLFEINPILFHKFLFHCTAKITRDVKMKSH